MAAAATIPDLTAGEDRRQRAVERHRTNGMTVLTGAWLLALTWWVSANLARLRIAKALIERRQDQQGVPITDDDHLSDFPDLHATFEALGLTTQTDLFWIFALGAFAVAGVPLALGAAFTPIRRPLLAVIATGWTVSVLVALANAETLSLLGWLNN